MTATVIACFIAGASTASFFALWFATAYRELPDKKRGVEDLAGQVQMHHALQTAAKNDTAQAEAARMLKTGMMIYNEAVKEYNRLLCHPFYCFPGFLMRFRRAQQMEEKNNVKEREI